jgi:uncharacterized linocin/CFP29 family protein
MADLLRRSLAPIGEEAWKLIDDTAMRVLKAHLSARTVVDFRGPYGWDFAAVNLGHLQVGQEPGPGGAPWGLREVLPLVEVRIPFALSRWDIDFIARGAEVVNLDPVEEAARKIALFEESAIYLGFPPGQIQGIVQHSSLEPLSLPQTAEDYPQIVADGVKRLSLGGTIGPFVLALGPAAYYGLAQSHPAGYPPSRVVREILQGDILFSPALDGGVLLSKAGSYFEMVVGQDISIGYQNHNHEKVDLFLTESFTFRVLETDAAIELKKT